MVRQKGVYQLPEEVTQQGLGVKSLLDAPEFLRRDTAPTMNPNQRKRQAQAEVPVWVY
jgi:hypothetical protein